MSALASAHQDSALQHIRTSALAPSKLRFLGSASAEESWNFREKEEHIEIPPEKVKPLEFKGKQEKDIRKKDISIIIVIDKNNIIPLTKKM